ncbi:MAG: hypothetical protein ACYDHN_06035 [Solirubrobacteraceae bacterium]
MKAIQLIAGLAALALFAAGCGGAAKSPTVAHLGSAASSTSSTSASGSSSAGSSSGSSGAGSPDSQGVAYSACMREHGVPNFPDPKISQSGNEVKVAVRVTPAITGNPRFQSAQRACSKLLPSGPGPGSNHPITTQEQSQYLKAAACIRSHGIPTFPDPTFSGGGVHVELKGIDPHSPQVRAAEEACQSLIPGGLHGRH